VTVLLVLLLVPGLIGFDAWPLTGWRLFSAERGAVQLRWEVTAETPEGGVRAVDLDDLPIAYRNAEWVLGKLPAASDERRERVCVALLGGVRKHLDPDVAGIRLVANLRVMEQVDGTFAPVDTRVAFARC
jgi:hypothetical protein